MWNSPHAWTKTGKTGLRCSAFARVYSRLGQNHFIFRGTFLQKVLLKVHDLVPFVQFKNVKNTHGGVLLLVKLPKSNTPPCVFFRFFMLYKWYQIAQRITNNCEWFSMHKKYPYWSEFFLHFPAFGLNTEYLSASSPNAGKCGKMRTRITPNTNTFYVVIQLA